MCNVDEGRAPAEAIKSTVALRLKGSDQRERRDRKGPALAPSPAGLQKKTREGH
jgi:hypothetical protein